MSESIVIDAPSIAISSDTISLHPAAMGLLIVVFFHAQGKDDSTPTDCTPVLNTMYCRIGTKAIREKQKDVVVPYWFA
jgi:hypothetical protein